MKNACENLPADLGGFQHVENGIIQDGDLLVSGCSPNQELQWALGGFVGRMVSDIKLWRVYRKSAVPKQGGLDHVFPEQCGVTSECGARIELSPAQCMAPANPGKALTNDDGKPPLANLPPAGIAAVAQVQAYGHKKYREFNNYRKGLEHSRTLSCAMRHIMAHMDGETVDRESSELHIAHAACRLLFLIQNIKDGTDIDDRYQRPKK